MKLIGIVGGLSWEATGKPAPAKAGTGAVWLLACARMTTDAAYDPGSAFSALM